LDAFFVDNWLYPTVAFDPDNEYTFTFSIKGPIDAKPHLDMALRTHLTALFGSVLSDFAGLLVSDVFDEVNSTLTIVDPVAVQSVRVVIGLPVDLGTCTNFTVLSRTGITSAVGVTIEGNIGVSPIASAAMTAFAMIPDPSGTFATSTKITGRAYAPDYTGQTDGLSTPAMLQVAIADTDIAHADAFARTPSSPLNVDLHGGNIGGGSFTSGVYKWNTAVTMASDITIQAATHCMCEGFNEMFIFIVTGFIDVNAGVRVILNGDIKWSNIIWVTTDGIRLAADSHMEGVCLPATLMSFGARSALNGRALVRTAVTLAADVTITQHWEPYTLPEADPMYIDTGHMHGL
jgi:hypothetical protein